MARHSKSKTAHRGRSHRGSFLGGRKTCRSGGQQGAKIRGGGNNNYPGFNNYPGMADQ